MVDRRRTAMESSGDTERFETVVVGGGQAGLSAGYYLRKVGRSFVILDANERIGDSWRRRYDSLRLFTPSWAIRLPGHPYPGKATPTKDEMADYLESYAARFELPVRTGVRVDRVVREGDRYLVTTSDGPIEADDVIVASGAHRDPRVPGFSGQMDPSIVQLHATEYKNPSQLRDGGVLVVGAGNSGADVSLDVAGTHPTWLSGPHRGHIPVDIDTWVSRNVAFHVIRFIGHHVLTRRTPIGRKAYKKFASRGDPLVRVKPKWLPAAGVERVPKTVGVSDGKPVLEDGQVLDVMNVIWCTGFRHDLSWIDLPIFGEDGSPMHERGVVTTESGLYFVGLPFQYAASSDTLPGVGRDAKYVVKHLVAQARGRSRPEIGVSTAA
jgi:putative flavoprotein involved in K+ transport